MDWVDLSWPFDRSLNKCTLVLPDGPKQRISAAAAASRDWSWTRSHPASSATHARGAAVSERRLLRPCCPHRTPKRKTMPPPQYLWGPKQRASSRPHVHPGRAEVDIPAPRFAMMIGACLLPFATTQGPNPKRRRASVLFAREVLSVAAVRRCIHFFDPHCLGAACFVGPCGFQSPGCRRALWPRMCVAGNLCEPRRLHSLGCCERMDGPRASDASCRHAATEGAPVC